MSGEICGNCIHYRHPAGGPICNKSKKSIGYFYLCDIDSFEIRNAEEIKVTNKTMEKEMKTKVCTECGRELPLEQFGKHARGYRSVCLECGKKKSEAKLDENGPSMVDKAPKVLEVPAKKVDDLALTAYTDEQLAEELHRRGYAGELKIMRTLTI